MRKVMTKKQKQKRFNDIKKVVYYSIVKVSHFITVLGIIMVFISCAADMELNPVSRILGYLAVSATVVVVSNFIASRLSYYLYRKNVISESRVVDSIFGK